MKLSLRSGLDHDTEGQRAIVLWDGSEGVGVVSESIYNGLVF